MTCHPSLFFLKKYTSDTSPSKVDDVSLASQFSSHHCNGENVRAIFFCQKPTIFKSFQVKTTSRIPLKHSQTNLSTQNTQKWDQKPEIKSVQIYLSRPRSIFLENIEAPKNHHQAPFISWNPWTQNKFYFGGRKWLERRLSLSL